jgi:DNA-binding CsgD family transcriptional regulator
MSCSSPPPEVKTLQQLTAASDYFARVSEVVNEIESTTDRWRAVELLEEATQRMGAQVAIFASFIRDDASGESYRLLLACDPQWCVEYEQKAWYENDPWLNYAIEHTAPIRGSEIPVATHAQRSIVELTQRFGFASSVIVPTPSSRGRSRRGVLCLGSSVPGYFEAEGYLKFKVVARSVAMELHEWWLKRLQEELVDASGITAAEVRLLHLERDGLSTKEISERLSMTPMTVNSRFQRIRAKLGVTTRKAAAHLAAEYGLL